MIPLYIVLYLVVGLIVKWLCERYEKEEIDTGDLFIIFFWPILIFFFSLGFLLNYLDNISEINLYIRIRKFFRGF